MTHQHAPKRTLIECYAQNIYKLQEEEDLLAEEKSLYLKMYFSSLIPPDFTFERAARSVMHGYRRLASPYDRTRLLLDEKVALCHVLSERFPSVPALAKPFLSQPRSAKIALWSMHAISSVGFEKFKNLFSTVEQVFAESFSEVCDLVANSPDFFGIVPVENTVDGRLSAFYKMLDRNELKICAVCDVEDPDTDTVTRLALICKNLCSFDGDFTRHLEISLVIDEGQKKAELLRIAEMLGISVDRVSSTPLSYRTSVSLDTIRLSFTKTNVFPFLIYLHLFCEDINILGFYIQM